MPAARYATRPKLCSTPRSNVSKTVARSVDTVLKELRACSRQFAALEPCLQDELLILERLYYKGVNQHRMAKFWKRVQELRRLGKRILEIELLSLVEDLRYAFYVNEGFERTPKMLRNAWQQVPDAKYARRVFERAKDLKELLALCKERFGKAYHSFSLMMQTGAFLQLILVLSAIVSRMDALLKEMDNSLDHLLHAVNLFLEILGEKITALPSHTETLAELPLRLQDNQASIVTEDFGEDLGSTIIRQTSEIIEEETASASLLVEHDNDTVDDALPSAPPPAVIISTMMTSSEEKIVSKRKAPDKAVKSDSKTRKKKKKDEIDDIFAMF